MGNIKTCEISKYQSLHITPYINVRVLSHSNSTSALEPAVDHYTSPLTSPDLSPSSTSFDMSVMADVSPDLSPLAISTSFDRSVMLEVSTICSADSVFSWLTESSSGLESLTTDWSCLVGEFELSILFSLLSLLS